MYVRGNCLYLVLKNCVSLKENLCVLICSGIKISIDYLFISLLITIFIRHCGNIPTGLLYNKAMYGRVYICTYVFQCGPRVSLDLNTRCFDRLLLKLNVTMMLQFSTVWQNCRYHLMDFRIRWSFIVTKTEAGRLLWFISDLQNHVPQR